MLKRRKTHRYQFEMANFMPSSPGLASSFLPKILCRLPVHVCYGCLALFISLLNNVFILYYVDMFVNVCKIDQYSFWIGEFVFLVWNSVNDPLFGWASDSKYLSSDGVVAGMGNIIKATAFHVIANQVFDSSAVVLRRVRALKKCGPLFALSFLLFWFPLGHPAIQFVVSLCLYDSCLTMVDLHHQALLADLAIKAKDRTQLNSMCSMFSALGSGSVFLSFFVWDRQNIFYFQLFCCTLSALCIVGFYICCASLEDHYDGLIPLVGTGITDVPIKNENVESSAKSLSAVSYGKQVLQHKNFMWFSIMNLLQVFHCHFNSNFFPLFLTNLLGHVITPGVGAVILGFSFLLPHLNNLYFLSLCTRYGSYNVIRMLFLVKLVLGFGMMVLGHDWWIVLCVYIACNRVFTEGTCKLLNLVISDLVDEDYVKNRRPEAVSALVFGMAALLSKPGQTLAPLLGTWFLFLQTGKSVFFNQDSRVVVSDLSKEDDFVFRHGCFLVLLYVPMGCATIQLFAWSRFTLKGWQLDQIKGARTGQARDPKYV